MDDTYHYPPELFALLVDAIAALFKGKRDVVLFFRGAGVRASLLADLEATVATDRDSISKAEIARTVLTRLNEGGDSTLAQRREVIKRITEMDDFSSAWANDRERAENLVGRVRAVVGKKDSFTRMNLEREAEARTARAARDAEAAAKSRRADDLAKVRADLGKLFVLADAQRRGKDLEPVLTRFFSVAGCRVIEAFELRSAKGNVVEQVDGVVMLDGQVYLVEAKWYKKPIGTEEIAPALVRTFGRAEARGLIVSASGFTGPAVTQVTEALRDKVIVLAELREIVQLFEQEGDPQDWLRQKVAAAITRKEPMFRPLG